MSLRADADLNREYQQLLHQYRDDVRFIRNARRAQRAWIAYRDAQLALLYPYAERRGFYGSVYPMCRCMAVLELTKKRVEELRPWVDGVQEGDVCSGSIKIAADAPGTSHTSLFQYQQRCLSSTRSNIQQ